MFDLRHTLDLIDDGALDEAAAVLRRAIDQMPAYTPAYVLLAETYESQNRWAEALATWQRARFFAPNSPMVEAGLLRALEHQDIVPEAVADENDGISPDEAMERMADELLGTLQGGGPDEVVDPAESAPPPEDDASPATGVMESARPEPPTTDEPTNAPAESPQDHADEPEEHEPAPEPPTADPVEPPPTPPPHEPSAEETAPASAGPDGDRDAEPDADGDDAPPDPVADEAATPMDTPDPPSAQPRPSPLDELARRPPNPDQPLPEDQHDLDRLIDELESARIDPQPEVEGAPEPNLDSDVDDMVSETLARIYIAQEQYTEAARVYVRLAHQDPDRADEYREKAAELREQARDADQ